MPNVLMAPFGGCSAKILQQEYPHRAGATAMPATRFRAAHDLAERELLTLAHLTQSVPELGLEPHARSPIPSHDVAIDQPTCHAVITPSPQREFPTNPTQIDYRVPYFIVSFP